MKHAYILLACIALFSCKKKDVQPEDENTNPTTPPPGPVIDLSGHFYGIINGSTVEYTEDVFGYNGMDDDSLYLNPSPSLSQAVYQFGMHSASATAAIEIMHGSVQWDNGVTSIPSLTAFNQFHTSDTLPSYANSGLGGFEVVFTDNSGVTWKSDATSMNAQSVSFNNVTPESGDNGDYAKFICSFTCYVYNANATDSLLIDNAVLKGWFKR